MQTPVSRRTIHARCAIPLAAACALLLAACGSSSAQHKPAAALGLEFATCMRSHGVPSFPDPEAEADVQIPISFTSDPSPAFTAAMHACGYLMPTGSPPVIPASQQAAALRFAQCMRRNGVPNFRDPVYHDDHQVPVLGSGETTVNLDSPAFKGAATACRTP